MVHRTQGMGMVRMGAAACLAANLFSVAPVLAGAQTGAGAVESLVIGASPSMKRPIEALGAAFEARHPNVKVRVAYNAGLDLRRTIATVGNDFRFFVGSGPIDLVAPGGDELIERLEAKYYLLPGTARAYAGVPLVLVVPVTLVEAPASFGELGRGAGYRIAVSDPALTELGRQTGELFESLGMAADVADRLDIASDARGVLDHLLLGQADVGILFGPDAVQEQERVRVVAASDRLRLRPAVHSMAMHRYCRNRDLCRDFLAFAASGEGQTVIRSLGYIPPAAP